MRIICSNCGKRTALREHQGVMDTFERYLIVTWQCRRCGAVYERGARGMRMTGIDRIILAPGELG